MGFTYLPTRHLIWIHDNYPLLKLRKIKEKQENRLDKN